MANKVYKIDYTFQSTLYLTAESEEKARNIFNEMSFEEVIEMACDTKQDIYEEVEITEHAEVEG